MQSPALTAQANSSGSDRGVAGRYSAPLGIKMDSTLDRHFSRMLSFHGPHLNAHGSLSPYFRMPSMFENSSVQGRNPGAGWRIRAWASNSGCVPVVAWSMMRAQEHEKHRKSSSAGVKS